GLHQYVVLEPNTQYRFTGYMKPVLESAHGPRFALINITNQSRYFVTRDVIHQGDWEELEARFTTGGEASIAVLAVLRDPGTTVIRGRVWIDDLQLVKESQ
ncbi:MAG TPA: hypothetical protein VN622_14160, partial [Clostridia bacterium]|nr:hypothetical protein [Clostridia bacterium]